MKLTKKEIYDLIQSKCKELNPEKDSVSARDMRLAILKETGTELSSTFFENLLKNESPITKQNAEVIVEFLGINIDLIRITIRKSGAKKEKSMTYAMKERAAFKTAAIGLMFHSRVVYE